MGCTDKFFQTHCKANFFPPYFSACVAGEEDLIGLLDLLAEEKNDNVFSDKPANLINSSSVSRSQDVTAEEVDSNSYSSQPFESLSDSQLQDLQRLRETTQESVVSSGESFPESEGFEVDEDTTFFSAIGDDLMLEAEKSDIGEFETDGGTENH